MKNILVLNLLIFLAAFTITAQNAYNLNIVDDVITKSKIIIDDASLVSDEVIRVRELRLNPVLQNSDIIKVDDRIILDLFSDKQYNAIVQKVEVDVNGTVIIVAKLIDHNFSYCIISTNKGESFLTIEVPEANEFFRSGFDHNSNVYYLEEVDKSKLEKLEGAPSLIPDVSEQQGINDLKSKTIDTPELFNAAPAPPINVTLLIVYTPAAAAWSATNEISINNTISLLMAKAQLAHNNSNSGITLQLVHSAQVAYVELDNGTDLSNLQGTSDGNMDNVHTLRNQYCADFVALLEVASYTGGHGYLLGSTLGSPDWAFSLTRVQQASWTFTTVHEIGHNMGLGHHKAQNFQAGPGLYTFSAGWRWTNAGPVYNCSVMTYESGAYFADGISHTRVAHFSDPAILYGGVATGDATDGDNARNLRLIAPVVAAYRADCLTTFIGGSDNLFSNPANWSGGSVPFANAHIIIAPSATLEVDVNYTCLSLRFGAGSSFYCTGGHVLTIDGDVLNGAGDVVVDVASSLVVRSSIEILNLPPPPPD